MLDSFLEFNGWQAAVFFPAAHLFLCKVQERLGRDAHPLGFDQGALNERPNGPAADLGADFGRRHLQNVCAASLLSRDDPGLVQDAVSARHRIEIDAQFLGQGAHGGQLVAGLQPAVGNPFFDAFDHLKVNGNAGAKINFEIHYCMIV